jgi:hypothetical protein
MKQLNYIVLIICHIDLLRACEDGCFSCTNKLVLDGSDIDIIAECGRTPLHHATDFIR